MGRLENIQTLRAVAALMVVLFHASQAAHGSVIFAPFGRFGAAGVDIFFVISGFVMTIAGDRVTPARFLADRFQRIAPLYWLITAAMVGASAIGLAGATFTPQEIWTSFAFIPWAGANGVMPVLHVGWTLNYEIMFYGLFAASMLFGRRRTAWLLSGLVALVLAGPLLSGTVQGRFFSNPIILEFGFGVVIATVLATSRTLPIWLSGSMTLVGVVLIVLLPASDEWRLLSWGVPGAMVVAGAVSAERSGFKISVPLVGQASYALYIVHVLVIAALLRITPDRGEAFVVLATAACLAAGIALHLLVEQPLLHRGGQVIPDRRPLAS